MVSSMSLSDDLRKAISDSGKTVYAVAKESGISQQVLGRFLRGERGINIETADRLAEYFKLRLAREIESTNSA
jgi:transcriptional regulator with XRE-family HTH domain